MGPADVVTSLKAIRDPRLRVLQLVGALETGDADAWAGALAAVITRAHGSDDLDAAEALETITLATADPAMSYATRQRMYEAARARDRVTLARLFLAASPPVDIPPQLKKQLGPERPLRPNDRPLTLGERKAYARTHRRELLLQMIRDPHPDVVAILLDNPHVTETDIVRVAAARPAVPASLALVAAHPKWSVRHAVKRSLVLNPATPLVHAIRIATTLRAHDLAELAADHALPEMLRRHAADVLAGA
jgi:hypothetical protein